MTAEYDALKVDYARKYIAHIKAQIQTKETLEGKLDTLEYRGLPGGIAYDKLHVKTSPTPDAIPDAVIGREEMYALISTMISEIEPDIADFRSRMAQIACLGAVYVIEFCFSAMTWNSIAMYHGRDVSTIRKRVDEALIALYDTGLPAPFHLPNQPAEV